MSVIALACGVVSALVAIINFLFRPPSWPVKLTKDGTLKVVNALALGAGVGLLVFFGISFAINHGSIASGSNADPARSSTAPTSSASPGAVSTNASPATGSEPKITPLRFEDLRSNESVGPQINVTLTGSVPSGEHLWIFVYTSGLYYVQSTPTFQPPDYWYLEDVDLGGSAAGDINAPYTIYAVLADPQANSAINALLIRTKSNIGASVIPDDAGVQRIAEVTVIRTH